MNNTQATQANTQLVTPLGLDCSYSLFGKKKTENLKEVDKFLKGAIASQFPELLKGGE